MIFFLLSLAECGNVHLFEPKVNWNPYNCFTSSWSQHISCVSSRIFTIIKTFLMGYFQETLSLLMDYSYISTWNKKNKICKKKTMLCLRSQKISDKEIDAIYNSNRNYKELLESKWPYFICKILLSRKRLIHSQGFHWNMFHPKFCLHNKFFNLPRTEL